MSPDDWGFGYGENPVSPTLPEPPIALVDAAMKTYPGVLSKRGDFDQPRPVSFLLVDVMEAGHSEAAAQWAMEAMVSRQLLSLSSSGPQSLVSATEALWQWWRSGCPNLDQLADDGVMALLEADHPRMILECLSERGQLSRLKIANEINRDVKTLDSDFNALAAAQLISPPPGKQNGLIITPRGRSALQARLSGKSP